LEYREIRVLCLSTISNQLAQGIQQVVLGLLVWQDTGSPLMVGVIFAARSAPNLAVGLVAGSITDRIDRRKIMTLTVWGMAAIAFMVAGLFLTGRLDLWHLLVSTFLLGTLQAFYMTARQVYVYDIVGTAGAINGIALISLGQLVGQIGGALLTGILMGGPEAWITFQGQGPGITFLVMGISYVLGAFALYYLRQVGQSAPMEREPMLENILNYFRALRDNRVMLSLMISTAAAETFGFSHQVMLPILALEVLGVGSTGLSLLTAARFAGGAIGVIALAALGAVQRRGMLLLWVLALFGIGQILLGQAWNLWTALLFVTMTNMMAAASDVLHQSLLQLSVPNQQRGRAMGSWIVGIGSAPWGQLQIGYISEITGSRVALLVNGSALIVVAMVMGLVLPRLRRL
jgi:MFS family permease